MTLQCRIFRRSCSMTKKQYSMRNVTVGTVKKSQNGQDLTVILQKGQPLLIGIAAAHDAPQITGDGPLRHRETELLQFGMDLGGAPSRILFGQAGDQVLEFLGNPRSTALRSRAPAAIEAEAGTCHAMTVAGLTIRRTSDQWGHKRWRMVQKSRSQAWRGGRGC